MYVTISVDTKVSMLHTSNIWQSNIHSSKYNLNQKTWSQLLTYNPQTKEDFICLMDINDILIYGFQRVNVTCIKWSFIFIF